MNITEIPKTERMAQILIHLIRNRTRQFTAADIQRWLNVEETVTLRNVQRDLKRLAETRGSCVVSIPKGRKIYYTIEPDMRGKLQVPIERNSLLALFMLKQLQPFFAPRAKTMTELAEMLDELSAGTEEELFMDLDQQLAQQTSILGEKSNLLIDNDTLNTLLTALLEKKRLKIVYGYNNKQSDICPVKILVSNNELYLVGLYDPAHKKNYYFKLCRINEAHLQEESFTLTPRQTERINKRFTRSFGILDDIDDPVETVELRFPSWFATVLEEKQFHPSQKIKTAKNGDTICTFKVPVGKELVRWVLGWADIVTVVRPEGLKSRIREVLKEFAERA
jgi:predicted DNA-binding transcriptional regulator YafY